MLLKILGAGEHDGLHSWKSTRSVWTSTEGHQNRVADSLNRLGFQQDRCEDGVDCEEVARIESSETTNPTVRSVSQMCSVLVGDIWSEDKFRAAQMDDTLLGEEHGLLRGNPMSALTIVLYFFYRITTVDAVPSWGKLTHNTQLT